MREQKENFDDRCVSPYNLELFMSHLTSNRALYSVSSDMWNHINNNKKWSPNSGILFWVKEIVSNHLNFHEDFNETKEGILLYKHKLDFAHISAYLADSVNVNFGKFSLFCKLTKENEKGIPVNCPAHFVHNTTSVVCSLFPHEIESLFSSSLMGRSAYKISYSMELEDISS